VDSPHHNGVRVPAGPRPPEGLHEPLVDSKTLLKVQDMFVARSSRAVREVRPRHYLKGTLVWAPSVAAASPSSAPRASTSTSTASARRTGAIPRVAVRRTSPPRSCQRVQLPPKWAKRLRASIEEEIVSRQGRNSAEREFLTRKLETERRKLLNAYYAGAIDVSLLRTEQERITREVYDIEQCMAGVEATLTEWEEILGIALKFATNCARAYRSANDRTRKLYNVAVFDRLLVRDGAIAEVKYREPFELIFNTTEFEQRRMERETRLELATSSLEG
jgi:site-specific DNA recombinase